MKIKLPQFEDKREMFSYLVKNKKDLLELKKSAVDKKTDNFGVSEYEFSVYKDVNKVHTNDTEDVINRTIIGNTYLFLDSHDDVHLPGLFSKSIQERKGKIWHLHDHQYELTSQVGKFKSVYENHIDWVKLGINKAGQTQSLFGDSEIMKELNPQIFKAYKSGDINQHSVSMQYVKMTLCINDEAYKTEYKDWRTYIGLLGNPDKAEENGFFWAQQEAKLKEISCVLEGSNELTGILEPDTLMQPLSGTGKEPSQKGVSDMMQLIKNTRFINI